MGLVGTHLLPGIGDVRESAENAVLWAGKSGITLARGLPKKIASTATDTGNTPNTTLRGGLVMASAIGETDIVPYVSGGNQLIEGLLFEAENMLEHGTAVDKMVHLITGGLVRESLIPNLDEYAKSVLSGMGFVFDNAPAAGNAGDGFQKIVVAADQTLSALDSGKCYLVNHTSAVTLTLPTIEAGLKYQMYTITVNDAIFDGASNILFGTSGSPHDKLTVTDIGFGVQVEAAYIDAAGTTLRWLTKVLAGTVTAS